MPAPKAIHELVKRFERNIEAYRSEVYNETQLRQEFVNPMFKTLGWDVDNVQGYAEAYKDVIHEDAIKVGGATKAPDYCFRIGGTRKFFVETKKPAVNLKEDISPAFQLRRYAWSAKLPLSILTDFEEFVVYDCRIRPAVTDKPSTARTLYLKFTDYLERWDDIASIFSREDVLKGSFDKYAESTYRKRGTAEVDDAFLAEIESWRDMLARNIALRNPGLTQRELNFAVQRTIDRIIFLRFCEDRGIEDYGRLQALRNGTRVYGRLRHLYELADQRYNSGLFYFNVEKDRPGDPDTLTPNIAIDDKHLKEIIKNLYYPESPYEFSVLPADILGHIYEQFLGKVIRLTKGHRAVVEEKPEVRKAGGVYYTPTYIVDYIVKNTVGKLVEGKKPGPRGGASKLRILDPACGSGSFLLGAYKYLLEWHLEKYVNDDPKKWARRKNPAIFQDRRGEWRLTTTERKRILLNNIYGVDIDPQAVEVTKLSLLLKVLEDESSETLDKQLAFLHERALPDLGNNIKCGNSLIDPDFYDNQQTDMFDEEEIYRINAFDWKAEFPEIMKARGFDAVIGNPPYGASLSENETAYLLANFRLQDYQLDTYLLFIEKCLALLKEKGVLGMIIPNTWLLNLQCNRIREHIFNKTQIETIVHYRRPVFVKATVDTEITIIKKKSPADTHEVTITVLEKDGGSINYTIPQERWRAGNGRPVNIYERTELVALADKLRSLPALDSLCLITQGAKPFQVGKGKPPQTRRIVEEKPFVSEKQVNSSFRPLLRGSLIRRYQIFWNNDYWISFGDWLAEPRYSANYNAPSKIVIRQTGDCLIATLDCNQFIVRDNLYTIIPRIEGLELRYILGLLNSRLLNWFYQTIINPEKGEALAQVKRGHLAQLPIAFPNLSNQRDKARHDRVGELVDRMLSLHKRLAVAKTDHGKTTLQRQIEMTDNHIDRLVYELYGLSDEDIAIVEGSS